MNGEAVRNWMRKAESDLKIGRDEMATDAPATDGICFHMQQCAEKYLKAFLIFQGEEIPRTHNLAMLITRYMKHDADFKSLVETGADLLTDYAVELRYGAEFYLPSVKETQQAQIIAERVREFVLKKLQDRGFEP